MMKDDEYLSIVHHDKLNLDFKVMIDQTVFKRRKEDDAVICFDEEGNCRKFLKGFLTFKEDLVKEPVIKKAKQIRISKSEPDDHDPIEEDNIHTEPISEDSTSEDSDSDKS